MAKVQRIQFVEIITKLILEIRSTLCITNQKSGYITYHKEIKDNNYFANIRDIIQKNEIKNGYSLFYNSELTKFSHMGKCNELAELLCSSLAGKLRDLHTKATLRIVKAETVDHMYVLVRIHLQGEKTSLWEIDAWDPRIIDRSARLNKSIKNEEILDYGVSPKTYFKLKVNPQKDHLDKILLKEHTALHKDIARLQLKAPKTGTSSREATPPREILHKPRLNKIYKDYTIENACEEKKLPRFFGEEPTKKIKLSYPQKVSRWQEKEPYNALASR